MGLDITAYSKIAEAEENEAFDETGELHDGFVQLYVNPDFNGRADEIKNRHAYRIGDSFSFRAGSYGGYNQWRSALAALVGTTPSAVWENPKPGPFMELINFSDCEGTIGASISAKLAKDFAQYQTIADENDSEYFRKKYEEWRKAFEMASDGGAVVFV